VVNDPNVAYVEFAKTDQDILNRVLQYTPEFLVHEYPQAFFRIPMSGRLRALV